ncbi:hypothetical protein IGJ02_002002 [Enterococcus sp. DIV0724b]|uniref:hypothetical protein n=1 Tax=Enterococcus sp. DIV0724b TaxID=2774694 RepID=UPI003D2FFFE5
MKKFTKLLGLCFLVQLGIFYNEILVDAAYDPAYTDFVPDPQANQKAIEILEENGALDSCPVPIEYLTTEEPPQSSYNPKMNMRAATSQYYIAQTGSIKDNQGRKRTAFRSHALAPSGFTWHENGIGSLYVTGNMNAFSFRPNYVSDYGTSFWYNGYYYRLFRLHSTDWGSSSNVWLSAWNTNSLVYNGGN